MTGVPLESSVPLTLCAVVACGVATGISTSLNFRYQRENYAWERKREEWCVSAHALSPLQSRRPPLPPSLPLALSLSSLSLGLFNISLWLRCRCLCSCLLRRDGRELENYPEGEKLEVVQLCVSQGVSERDATAVVETLAKYKTFFVDLMMAQELLLQYPRFNAAANGAAACLPLSLATAASPWHCPCSQVSPRLLSSSCRASTSRWSPSP
jgi:hypothetical protein